MFRNVETYLGYTVTTAKRLVQHLHSINGQEAVVTRVTGFTQYFIYITRIQHMQMI